MQPRSKQQNKQINKVHRSGCFSKGVCFHWLYNNNNNISFDVDLSKLIINKGRLFNLPFPSCLPLNRKIGVDS